MPSRDGQRLPAGTSTPSPPTEVALEQHFDEDTLFPLRSAVAAHAGSLGLSPARVGDLVVVAHELASNAVRHGGGSGRLRLWTAPGLVYCEVRDTGGGLADPGSAGRRKAPADALGGRGLWIARELADEFTIATGPAGTTFTVAFATA